MGIPIWSQKTGNVYLRSFDQGIFDAIGAVPDFSDPSNPCGQIIVPGASNQVVKVFLDRPEAIFRRKIYPCIVVDRDIQLAMNRYMGVGQLEHRVGVSGTGVIVGGRSGYTEYTSKFQAIPHDITYTISAFDKFENTVQPILQKLLNAFRPIGKVYVTDDLGLLRSYEAYREGGVASLHEVVDPVIRVRGYAITVRVEGELDDAAPAMTSAVTGVDLWLHRI